LETDVLGISLLNDGFKQLAMLVPLEISGLASSEECLNDDSTVVLPPQILSRRKYYLYNESDLI